ncbi:MAG: ACP S-malonyltransferase [Ardenticatenia bacterium]|nr:ACP S-malonyltransferase [Ardenticatenia bacterium]
MSESIAHVFPGQGAQRVGMGRDVYEAHPLARELFDVAGEILGFDLKRLCFEGPKEALDDTVNTQPALYVTCVALWRVVQHEGLLPPPACVAGHSLGEYSALTAAGALPFEAGVRLVRERGRLMKEAGQQVPGKMAAIIGLDDTQVMALCREAARQGEVVQVANDNCPGQLVISGTEAAVRRAVTLAREQGARRAIILDVSIAAHSPLMAPVKEQFAHVVAAAPITAPTIPIIGNVTARPLTTEAEIRHELVEQLTGPVRWTESIQYIVAQGIGTFVEFGAGAVLTGLIKRIDRRVRRLNVAGWADVETLRGRKP